MNSRLWPLFVGLLFLTAPSRAQERATIPDVTAYEGTWVLDPARSEATSTEAGVVKLNITGAATYLRIDATRKGDQHAVVYRLDGAENINAFGSGTAVARVRWQDDKLVTSTIYTIQDRP